MAEKTTGKLPTPKIKRGGIKGFVKDLQREAKLVSWPTPKETTRLTGTVLAVCFMAAGMLFVFTLLVQQVFKILGVQ